MKKTILVVDDKSSVRQLLSEYLTEQGFKVLTAVDGNDALIQLHHDNPNLILLDIMMPNMDGYQFLRIFREDHETPVMIITAREEETDAVLGLDLGADDYIIKPFRMRELLARIKAILRRSGDKTMEAGQVIRVGDVVLDQSSHTVTVKEKSVLLTPIEFDLLTLFMKSAGQAFTRTQLVDHLLTSGFTGLDRTLNVHIRNLRMKIEVDAADPKYIETVFGIGYRFHKAPEE
ncbi:MAG: response regulator transcription factor [Anaerolineaceae bacterium]